ncbi:MAG: flavodoxin domain-containing protein [Candidatus Poseidoniaceae archaeon]|jgi:flavodoxin/succinate dehydrogenase/fumarate reductase-like Fe-S protein/ferredoxin|nr:flavodoxin domain-containing protein [Candidatus Poseidoniaceae archaeon]
MPTVAKVWIEEDCITCDACEDILPEVFEVTDESSLIKSEVREDGLFDRNTGFSAIKAEFRSEFSDLIEEAADACPVEIIKYEFESASSEESAEEVAPVAEEVVATPVAATTESVTDNGVLANILSGDRSIAIFFGSQTGNAAELAEKTAKLAVAYGLNPTVLDMDGYDPANFNIHKRVLIITSTWGEGEMPDNAEELWNATCGSNPALAGVHFSVCAIGDTSYDEFCKAGLDWDEKFAALGATRVHEIKLCDVDYEPEWKNWVNLALPNISCVDSDGVFHSELVEAMIAYGAGDEEDSAADGDFTPPNIIQDEISVTLRIFRYDPIRAESGWDTVACALPGHATIEDALVAVQQDLDGSLTFRRGGVSGINPLTGVKANGRIVPADTVRISEFIEDGGTLRIEPVPGYDVVKDLMVSYDRYNDARAMSNPWMDADPRQGERLVSGAPMGSMSSSEATSLHTMADVGSLQLVNSMSDTYDVDSDYEGPGIALQRWVRSQDSRSGQNHTRSMFELLQRKGGVWDEADISSIHRHGIDGSQAADSIFAARARLLAEYKFTGKPGRLVKNYSRSLKSSGNVNETTLYRSVLGPLGLGSNIMNGVSLRMVLGFTRNGGPMMRGFQGMLVPPAGIGKIPNMFNSKVVNHHEVVAIFNELDRRF